MKKIIFLVLIFSLFITNLIYCQMSDPDNFRINCDSIRLTDCDTIQLENYLVLYKVMTKSETVYYDTKKQRHLYHGEVLIPNLDSKIDSIQLVSIFNIIGTKYKIDELIGFRTCEARRILYQSMIYLPEQEEHLKENYIGSFKIEL